MISSSHFMCVFSQIKTAEIYRHWFYPNWFYRFSRLSPAHSLLYKEASAVGNVWHLLSLQETKHSNQGLHITFCCLTFNCKKKRLKVSSITSSKMKRFLFRAVIKASFSVWVTFLYFHPVHSDLVLWALRFSHGVRHSALHITLIE